MKEAKNRDDSLVRRLTDDETGAVAGGIAHGQPSASICRRCGIAFPDAYALREHMQMAHQD